MRVLPIIIIVSLLICLVLPASGFAWIYVSKPAYQGKVVDLDTGAPIEGAAVVAIYHKDSFGLGTGDITSVIHVKETLTDQDGQFYLPPYRTLVAPYSWESATYFTIYKPGYTSIYEMDLENVKKKVFFLDTYFYCIGRKK